MTRRPNKRSAAFGRLRDYGGQPSKEKRRAIVISQPAQNSHDAFARSRRSLGCGPSSYWTRQRSDARTLHLGGPGGAGESDGSFACDLNIQRCSELNEVQQSPVPYLAGGIVRLFWRKNSVFSRFSGEKRLSPRRAPRPSLLPLSPKRTQVRLKSLLYRVWLAPDSLRTHGRPSGKSAYT
jgi:hypothetical protein